MVCIVLVSLTACSKDNVLPQSSNNTQQQALKTNTPANEPVVVGTSNTSPTPTPTPTQAPKPAQDSKTNTKANESVNLTDNDVKVILKELIPKARNVYGVFNGTEPIKFDETKTIPGDKDYLLVTGEKINMGLFNNVKSMTDFKNAIEGVFTKDIAQKIFYSRFLEIVDDGSKERPYYKGYEGQLYIYKWMGGHGVATDYLIDTAKLIKQNGNIAEVELDTTLFGKQDKKLKLTIEYINDKWLLASSLV